MLEGTAVCIINCAGRRKGSGQGQGQRETEGGGERGGAP